MPVDYQDGKVYCIRSHQTDKVYVGSTCQALSARMAGHRRQFNCFLNGKQNKVMSFDILQYNDAYIELICNHPCNNKEELLKEEGHYIRTTPNCINKTILGRTRNEYGKEYYDKNKETVQEKQKVYRENNKDKIKLNDKKYYEENKEKIQEYKKKWCEENKEIIKQKKKQYYEENKDKKKEYDKIYREMKKEIIHCPCGGTYNKPKQKRHDETQKHKHYLETLNNIQ
jgi:hypothetical protein